MEKTGFSLAGHPWLFLLVFILMIIAGNILLTNFLVYAVKLPRNAPTFALWLNGLNNSLMVFIIAPFGLGFLSRSQPYTAYLSEIRLTQWQPVLKLFLLGVSCWLILALSQVTLTFGAIPVALMMLWARGFLSW